MKSEHRHELKTNELADWLAHLPQWSRDNARTLGAGAVLIAVVVVGFSWYRFNQRVRVPQQHLRLTNLISRAEQARMTLLQSTVQGGVAEAGALTQVSLDLGDFARHASGETEAATAYLQQARTILAEIHLRDDGAAPANVEQQLNLARDSYEQARSLAGSDRSLAAAATYGLGLCAEESGQVAEARRLYTELAEGDTYAGTVSRQAAAYRLDILSSLQGTVTFRPGPPKPAPATADPNAPATTAAAPGAGDVTGQALNAILGPAADGNGPTN